MKTFWKAFAVAVLIIAVAGCPSGNNEPGGGDDVTPVGAVTVTYNSAQLTTANGLIINAGEQTADLTPSAENADTFIFQSSNNSIVSVQSRKLTGVAAGTATITCSATNESGGAASAQFSVTVRPKLTSFGVYFGADEIDYEEDTALGLNINISLQTKVSPTGAENKFDWTIDTSAPSGLMTLDPDNPGVILNSSTAGGPYTITVTPTQAGLADAVTAKTFTITFSSDAGTPITEVKVYYPDGEGLAEEIPYNGILLKRGRAITLVAEPDEKGGGTSIEWDFTSAVVTKVAVETNAYAATFIAADGDAGDNVSITAKVTNNYTTGYITKTFTINVPERGNTIFEWYADENPDERGLANDGVRNYPGFRDVYIQPRGAILPFNVMPDISATVYNDFRGMRLGLWNATEGTQARHPRLMIGAAVNIDSEGVATAAFTGADTNSTNTNVGTLDLSKPVKITVDFDDYAYTTQWYRFYVNNNSSTDGNSNLGNASQVQHYNTPAATARYFEEDCVIEPGSKKGTYTYLINYDVPTYYPGSNTQNIEADKRQHLEKAFVGIVVQNNVAAYINITGIKLEYVAQADITINRDADFAGFPTETFTVSAAEGKPITLNGAGYDTAQWYIDGIHKADGLAYTVQKGTLANGEHSLTAIISVNGQLYSKTIKFTVTD